MGRAIGIFWQSIKDFYDELFPFVGLNLVWVVLSAIPFAVLWVVLLPLTPYLVGALTSLSPSGDEGSVVTSFVVGAVSVAILVLLIILPSPAAAGVHYYANRKVNDEHVEFSLVLEGLRAYWWKSLLLFLISLAATAVLVGNIVFYLSQQNDYLRVVAMFFLWVLFLWLVTQMYLLPLLMEQASKSIRLIYRNAFVLALSSPGVSLVLFVLVVVVMLLGLAFLPIIALLVGSLIALMEQRAVVTLLERYRTASGK
jgi:uncharacterized membrane protein YesL